MEGTGCGSSSSTDNLSSMPKTEVEVFQFREVEASPAKPSKDVGAQVGLSEETELDILSDRSSVCDCPAHVHDKEFPLEISKGHEEAFDGLSMEKEASIWKAGDWNETGALGKQVDEILEHNSETGAPKLIIESASPDIDASSPKSTHLSTPEQRSKSGTPQMNSKTGTPEHKHETETNKDTNNTETETQRFQPWERSEAPLFCSHVRGESRRGETEPEIWTPQWTRDEMYGRDISEIEMEPPAMYRVETPEIGTDEMGHPLYFPPNYSYGCLMKKWSL